MGTSADVEISNILKHYDLGELVWYEQDERGFVNTSFAIQTEKDGVRKKYFLRRYKPGVRREELEFEHSLISQLTEKDFGIIARLIKTLDGNTYLLKSEEGDLENGVFYAIFDFLGGEDRYTWISPVCSPTEIASAAEVLADFHRLSCKVVTAGLRTEHKILNLLPMIDSTLQEALKIDKGTIFDSYLVENASTIHQAIEETVERLHHRPCGSMVNLVIHCDYHPGNLKFDGEKVVGLFDFDWSKIDLRCYDVALALWYFFTGWEDGLDGMLRLDDCEIFLATYQDTLIKKPGLEPLTSAELNCLPDMISAANLYVLNWTLLDYIQKNVDPEYYLIFLQHGVNSIRWLEEKDNQANLRRMLERLNVPENDGI